MVRLCLPDVELTDGAYFDGGAVAQSVPAAQEERSVKQLVKLADQLVGQTV
ncbi:hypothetical protein ACH4E7_10290 [Kitasatospora sp. NPDC018058]|uniref:hypothetical protein n=1 Tax=Kitasatospora sp. NPDC018058 TaxID=3364025 RepID=UPI0037BE3668